MVTSEKIDEWIKEAEQRPGSALTILKLIAGRLRDLSERNEELLNENIALQDGSRVKEYEGRITHLEYQLELLKRGLGDGALPAEATPAQAAPPCLLAYNAHGRILRFDLPAEGHADRFGRISGDPLAGGEPARLLALSPQEDVLLVFTTGRVATCAVASLPVMDTEATWEQAHLPEEPHAGELLACLLPVARLPLADFFLQASRRGCIKKTLASMTRTILSNHYLGRGTIQKADQPFDSHLCQKGDRFVLVSSEGRLICLDVDELPYAAEERIRLGVSDHVTASFLVRPAQTLLFVTQAGKVLQREYDTLDPAKSRLAQGQALISPARLDQGTRFVGAAAAQESDRLAVLDAGGTLSLHALRETLGAGSVRTEGLILSIGLVPAPGGKRPAA